MKKYPFKNTQSKHKDKLHLFNINSLNKILKKLQPKYFDKIIFELVYFIKIIYQSFFRMNL